MATPKTILLRVNSRHAEPPLYEMPATDAAILPGHFLLPLSTGKVDGTPVAGAWTPRWIALETPYIDPTVVSTAAIDTAYAADDRVRIVRLKAGDEVYALLEDEGVAVIGSPIAVAAGGEVKVGTPGTDEIIGVAIEAVDNTGGTGAVRLRVAITN